MLPDVLFSEYLLTSESQLPHRMRQNLAPSDFWQPEHADRQRHLPGRALASPHMIPPAHSWGGHACAQGPRVTQTQAGLQTCGEEGAGGASGIALLGRSSLPSLSGLQASSCTVWILSAWKTSPVLYPRPPLHVVFF